MTDAISAHKVIGQIDFTSTNNDKVLNPVHNELIEGVINLHPLWCNGHCVYNPISS